MKKSGDQRDHIFRKLRTILRKYEPPFVTRRDYGSRYELWSVKNVTIAGRKRKEVFFAALIIQSSYVGFYYMPIYAAKGLKKFFKKELLSTLKGKSCFHIKELNPVLVTQIAASLRQGLKLYRLRGWI
jgi:hypothetical protein